MGETQARLIVWSGGLAIAIAGLAALLLNIGMADQVYAARLIAGFVGCL